MSLEDVLYHAEMDMYFCTLPDEIKEKLRSNSHKIQSSNDLYRYGEEYLSASVRRNSMQG